jgi:hypothetical protein
MPRRAICPLAAVLLFLSLAPAARAAEGTQDWTLEEVDEAQAQLIAHAQQVTGSPDDILPGPAADSDEAHATRAANPARWAELVETMKQLLEGRYIEKHYVQPAYPAEHGPSYGPYFGKYMFSLLKRMRDEGFLSRGGFDRHRTELRWRIGGFSYIDLHLRGGDPKHKGNRIYKDSPYGNRWKLPGPPPTVRQWLDQSAEAA